MCRNKTIIYGALLLCISSDLYSLTITSTLAQRADVDVFISKNAPIDPTNFVWSFTNQSQIPIATYSFVMNQNNATQLWQTVFNSAQIANSTNINHLFPATSRIAVPTTKTNPFTLELSTDEIELLTGESLGTVYVIVQQRTYYFDPISQRVFFFSRITRASGFYGSGDTIAITATGSINSTMWARFPDNLKTIYAIAQGNV